MEKNGRAYLVNPICVQWPTRELVVLVVPLWKLPESSVSVSHVDCPLHTYRSTQSSCKSGAASAMTQGITDVVEYMNRRKRELVPYMKQGIDYLESHEIDERMLLFLPKMCRKMEAYAGLQSRGAAPDKNTYRLNASVRAFEKAVKNGDKKAALEAFQKYQDDVPEGIARFDIHIPETFEGPKDVNLPAAT